MHPANWKDYLSAARVDHWTKQIFVLPGVVTAWLLSGVDGTGLQELIGPTVLGILATSLVASSNYLLNEWRDSAYDRHHPLKSNRPFVVKMPNRIWLWTGYTSLVAGGFLVSMALNSGVFWTLVVFLVSGWGYNLKPLRSKDIPFLDVITESFNNPLRFLVGWFLVTDSAIPPTSILIAFWTAGAFLMGIKRFAEYRTLEARGGLEMLKAYRGVFRVYTEHSLLISSFFYALMSAFMMGVFLIKYRIEYLLLFPLISGLFASYLRVALKPSSRAQKPEKLIREKTLWVMMALLMALFLACSLIDIPQLHILIDPYLG